MNVRQTKSDTVLELQQGVRTFVAHLKAADSTVTSLAPQQPFGTDWSLCGLGW